MLAVAADTASGVNSKIATIVIVYPSDQLATFWEYREPTGCRKLILKTTAAVI
jgi:hypothetical protein